MLGALVIHRVAAAVKAEVTVWEADTKKKWPLLDVEEEDKMERTTEYINSHFNLESSKSHPPIDATARADIKASRASYQPSANKTCQLSPENPRSKP